MKSSSAFKKQLGFSALSVLVIIILSAIVIFQMVSILRQKHLLLQQPLTASQADPNQVTHPLYPVAQVVKPSVNPVQNIEKYLVAEAALLGVTDNLSLYY